MTSFLEGAPLRPRWAALAKGAVPASATTAAWLAGLAIFALFVFRLVFTTVMQRALPGLDAFPWLPLVVAGSFAAGAVLGNRAVLAFLVALPALAALNGSRIVTVWQFPEIVFGGIVLGWLARRILTRQLLRIPSRWPDLAVGCLFVTLGLSALWAALVPSAINGWSVAFSIPAFSDKSEFNFLEMTPALAGGCVVFLLLRTLAAEEPERFAARMRGAILAQFGLVAALAALSAGISLAQSGAVTRNLVWLPFGSIQLWAGPASLFGGFFAGALLTRGDSPGRRPLDLALFGLALLGMVLSTSKVTWLVAVVLLGLVAFRFFRWKGVALVGGGIALLAAAAFAWIVPHFSRNQIAREARILLNAQDWSRQGTAVERILLWDTAAQMALRYPLTGLGLGSFSSAQDRFAVRGFYGTLDWRRYSNPPVLHADNATAPGTCYNAYYAHNDLLEVATGSGLPSAALLAVIGGVAVLAGIRPPGNPSAEASLARAGAWALVAFVPISFLDSRLLYFANSVLFWQFAAVCFAAPAAAGGFLALPKRAWLTPLAVPATFVAAAVVIGAFGLFPANRTYGVWNWRQQTPQGHFLIAREAQFLIPPQEKLDSLIFQIPWDAGEEGVNFRVQVDGRDVARRHLVGSQKFRLRLAPYRPAGQWTVVRVVADRWAGRGFLGTPLGAKFFSLSLRKLRPPAAARPD